MASGNQVRRPGDIKPDLKSITVSNTLYQGALPPPEMLQRFEEIVPGGAERLFVMAETEMKHRHQHENEARAHWVKETARGQIFAFFIVIFCLIAAVTAGVMGAQWVGSCVGAGGIIGLAGIFIAGRKRGE